MMKWKFVDYLVMLSIILMTATIVYLIFDEDNSKEVVGQKLTLNTGLEIEKEEEQEEIEEEHNKEEIEVESIEVESLKLEDTNLTLAYEIVNYALQFVGNPYVYGGNSLTEGTDCSGFTSLIFANYGISLPRSSFEQGYVGSYIDLANIQVGDLVLYGYDGIISHVALYIGNNEVVHALNSNVGIVVTNYEIMPIITIRRVL